MQISAVNYKQDRSAFSLKNFIPSVDFIQQLRTGNAAKNYLLRSTLKYYQEERVTAVLANLFQRWFQP